MALRLPIVKDVCGPESLGHALSIRQKERRAPNLMFRSPVPVVDVIKPKLLALDMSDAGLLKLG